MKPIGGLLILGVLACGLAGCAPGVIEPSSPSTISVVDPGPPTEDPTGGPTGGSTTGVDVERVPNPSPNLAPVMRHYAHPDSDSTGSFADGGYDMIAPCGTDIYSAANGYVMDYFWAGQYGYRLTIDHGIIDGKHVVAAHNHVAEALVSPGSQISQGQVVARVGSTGAASGCHNHYLLWMDDQVVDPTPYLN